MTTIRQLWLYVLGLAGGIFWLFSGPNIQAEVYVFSLDPAQSSLKGDMFLVPLAVYANSQDPPNDTSMTASFSGSMAIDLDNPLNPSLIEFLCSNAIAGISGDWLPETGGGSEGDPEIEGDADPGQPEPANYGWYLDAGAVGQFHATARDVVLSVHSYPRGISGNTFDALELTIEVPQGVYYANVSSALYGDEASTDELTDEIGTSWPTTDGGYTIAGGFATITVPLNFVLGQGSDVEVTFTGQLVARAPYPLVASPAGDFDLDNDTDGNDFLVWQKYFGLTETGRLCTGDANGDQAVDSADLDIWATHFGTAAGGRLAGDATVPEPCGLVLGLLLGLAFCIRLFR